MAWKVLDNRTKLERTADLGTIFIRNATETDPDTEKVEKAQKLAQQKQAAEATSRLSSAAPTPKKGSGSGAKKSGTSTPSRVTDARQLDLSALNLNPEESPRQLDEPPPKMTMAREKVLEEAKRALKGKDDKRSVNLVVIGKCFFSFRSI